MPMNFSPAGQALGLGGVGGLGNDLMDQVVGETDELRKKRLLQQQQNQLLGLSPTGSTAVSAAGTALGLGTMGFGSMTSTGLVR
jgi:hypothetical protein